MQHKIIKLSFLLFLLFISGETMAQTGKDSIIKNIAPQTKWISDSLQVNMHYKVAKMDSVRGKVLNKQRENVYRYKNRDSFIVYDAGDSVYKKMHWTAIADSLQFKFKKRKLDSLHFKNDSLHYRMKLARVKSDSFHYKRLDSMHVKFSKMKMDAMHFKLDTLHNGFKYTLHEKMKFARLDSCRQMKNTMCDSALMKMKIEKLESQLKRLKKQMQEAGRDSVKLGELKAVTLLLACNNDATVKIEVVSKNIKIRQSETDNVRLIIFVDRDEARGKAENVLLRSKGIAVSGDAENLKIENGDPPVKKNMAVKTSGNNTLIVYVPANAKIKIDNSFGDVTIEKNIKDIDVTIRNGNLVMRSADKAVINSSNGYVTAAVIKDADIKLSDSRLNCETIEKLNIDSRYSNVSFARASAFVFKSISDKYNVQQVDDVSGDKTFGEFRLSNLKNSFVLTGSSADVKINNIDLNAALVKIDNKYADIKLPVKQLENYSVDFGGDQTNVSAPFEKQVSNNSINKNGSFTAAVGDVNSGHTKFQIKCNSCFVDFN